MSRGVRRVYAGPCDEIETLLDGARVVVKRGDVVDVSRAQAELLDAQEGMWEPTTGPADVKPRDTEESE